jgi:Ca2+-binding EF-hand superfamily protein
MLDTVNELSHRLKEMGLNLGDIFRMADFGYLGEITKEQFMKTIMRLKSNLEEGLINEMFYAIDTNLNGIIANI